MLLPSVAGFVVASLAAGLAIHEAVGADADINHGLAEAAEFLAMTLIFRLLALHATILGGSGSCSHGWNVARERQAGNVTLVTESAASRVQ